MKIHFAKMRKLSSQGRYYLMSMLLIVTLFLGVLPNSTPVNAAIGSVTQYTAPNSASGITKIGAGPDGNVWYTTSVPNSNTSRIVKVTPSGSFTEYSNPLSGGRNPLDITTGPDGNIWFSELTASTTSRIVKLSTSGTGVGQYLMSTEQSFTYADSLTAGSNGDLWYTYGGKIGRVSSSGSVTYNAPPYGIGYVQSITLGSDGNIWYVAQSTGISSKHSVGKMTPEGVFTNYEFPSTYGVSKSIITGPDGNLWFTMAGKQFVVKVTLNGVMTEYSPGTGSQPYAITSGTDGNLWYTSTSNGKVGRLTPSGVFTEFSVAGISINGGTDIVASAGGFVWIQEKNLGKLFRVSTELNNQTISFTSNAPTTAVVDGPTYVPVASATSGLPVALTIDPSSSDVCSVDANNVISFQETGTCSINADQAGDVDYKPAPRIQQSFNVLPVDADSSVSLNCPSNVVVGGTMSCTITVANDGLAASENASLTALFPSSFSSVSLSGGGTVSGQYVTWTTPSLASGGSVTLTLTATLSAPGKQRLNAALLQTSPDPSSLNNIVDATIVVN